MFFFWSFDLLSIYSHKYLLFGVYFSLHQRNTVYKYKLQRKHERDTNRSTFSRASDINFEKSYFIRRVKIAYQQLLVFLSFLITFLKVIEQPSCRGVNLKRHNNFYFSTRLTKIVWCVKSQTWLLIYLSWIVSLLQITPSRCTL